MSAVSELMSAVSEPRGLNLTTTLGIATPKPAVNAIAPMTVHSTDAIAPREIVGLTSGSIPLMLHRGPETQVPGSLATFAFATKRFPLVPPVPSAAFEWRETGQTFPCDSTGECEIFQIACVTPDSVRSIEV